MMRILSSQASLNSNRRGGAMLELALCFPILVYLLVAVSDFGRYYLEESRLGEVAAAAARQAAAGKQPDDPAATLSGASIQVETFCACPAESEERFTCGARSCGAYGEPARYVQVSAERSFSFLSRYPGFPSTFSMHRKAGVRTR